MYKYLKTVYVDIFLHVCMYIYFLTNVMNYIVYNTQVFNTLQDMNNIYYLNISLTFLTINVYVDYGTCTW